MKIIKLICIFVITALGTINARLSMTLKGGIDPTFFTTQPNMYAAVNSPDCALTDVGKDRKFSQLFHNPGYGIGIEVAYGACGYREAFLEFTYRHHNSLNKPFSITLNDVPIAVENKLKALNMYGAFLGFRYFFNRVCCERLAFFLGAKVGISHYNEVKTSPLTLTNANVSISKNTAWFNSNNTIAGGIQAGFDVILHGCFSLFGTAEILAGSALRSKAIIDLVPETAIPVFALIRQTRGTLFSFPVNLGLRYYFS